MPELALTSNIQLINSPKSYLPCLPHGPSGLIIFCLLCLSPPLSIKDDWETKAFRKDDLITCKDVQISAGLDHWVRNTAEYARNINVTYSQISVFKLRDTMVFHRESLICRKTSRFHSLWRPDVKVVLLLCLRQGWKCPVIFCLWDLMFTLKMVAVQSHFCFHSWEQHEGWDCSSSVHYGIPVLAHARCSINIGGMDTITPHATTFKYDFDCIGSCMSFLLRMEKGLLWKVTSQADLIINS